MALRQFLLAKYLVQAEQLLRNGQENNVNRKIEQELALAKMILRPAFRTLS